MRALFLSIALLLTACSPSNPEPGPPVAAGAPFPDLYEGPADILTVMDAGYPMYVVTARVEGYDGPIDLLLNDQAADLGETAPETLAGRTAILAVITERRNALAALTLDGAPLMAPTDAVADPAARVVIGVLEGAAAPTSSDLPDVLTIAAEDGRIVTFEAFVTPEMTVAEGQTVTATYVEDLVRTITKFRPAPSIPVSSDAEEAAR